MEIIVITHPEALDNEAQLITAALEKGASRVHIRKPSWSADQTRELIEQIPQSLRGRLSLHDHFELCATLGVGGIQLNGRNPQRPAHYKGVVSRSCHTLEELKQNQGLDYLTLSPIFDSISKQGYSASFSKQELMQAKAQGLINAKTIALGGITPEHLPYLHSMGFAGAALLGYIWQQPDVEGVEQHVMKAVKMARMVSHFRLQYITHRTATINDVEGAQQALEGGCPWVQLRMKGFSDQEFVAQAHKLRALCQQHNAIFLLNDRAHLVSECQSDGVHLGKNDMAPSKAREMLSDAAIIGGTANTFSDIDYLVSEGVDYIGLGPFRFTTTKDNLSPVLGLQGYKDAIDYCTSKGYTTPIVAIGGIKIDDINNIMECGVNGIALSGTILGAENIAQTTNRIMTILEDTRR